MRNPANLPALLQSFFTTRLMTQRKVSPHTIASYRDTFRLLLQFAQKRLKRCGARWKEDTGQHIVQLRALALSDRWEPAIELTLRPLRMAVRAA